MQSNQVSQQYFNSQQQHRNQNNMNYFLDPSLQFVKSDFQSRSNQHSSLINYQIDSPTITEIRQHKKLMQIFNKDIKNKDNINNYLTEQVKKSKDNLEDINQFVQKQNLILLNNKQKQNMIATFNDLKTKANERQFKTSRISQTNDDKKKSKSQHQQNMLQNLDQQLHLNQQCIQEKNCSCAKCQIKVIYEKIGPYHFHQKQDDNIISQVLEQKGQQVKSLNYSTQDNCQIYPDIQNIQQDQRTQDNSYVKKSLSYYQNNTLQKSILSNQIEQFQDNNTFNLPESSRNSLSGSTCFNDAINQQQQVKAQEVLQSGFYNKQQEDVSKEQMLSQMYDQNTQLQQLIKDQQDYIQILYKQMVLYQNLLDHYKIPYSQTKNKLQPSESNFSLQGSTAAPSPVISQLCHSSRTSDFGQLDQIDSSNQEQYNQFIIQDKNQQTQNFKQLYEQFNLATAKAKLNAMQQQQKVISNECQAKNIKYDNKSIQQNNFFNSGVLEKNTCEAKNFLVKSFVNGCSSNNLPINQSNDEKQLQKLNKNSIECFQQRRKSIFNQNSNQMQNQDSIKNDDDQIISSNTVSNCQSKFYSSNESPIKIYQDLQKFCLSSQNLDQQIQNHYMINSARNFSSTSSPQKQVNHQVDIQDMMQSFKIRFRNFLQNLKKKSIEKPSQFSRKNMLINKSLIDKSANQNNYRQQMFMSPQCSPQNKNNSKGKQMIHQEQFSTFQLPFQRKQNQQYFCTLNKIIESQKLTNF
ncbi:hypothetical protein TTHERM_00622860 (macronuclear) [Tetrahymena thermophila SB210]|uniref:Uncharacterized protein n=1 Tax=Tetrahymena thermophila (strain SB210) TaxID=312017 RepID=Q240Z8_TETTS|nr:hypothetical protein TTHERM_00622860 [Tetrahymena thermophila SB210]EAS02266.2 hypothetical protein TTHERM_00622860 [Tetrahymena thermophila SB210]|eukprot:XP_001022511.2 hypothetical protein TTHERM_00622860 [Tetrahymena thermophila SB210]